MTTTFLADVLSGLSATPKTLPSKHFYDAEGSRLFEAITALPEYYPTRTETSLLRRIAPEIAARIPRAGVLVEFGSGASVKTRILLDAAPQLAVYAPIDISADALADAVAAIRRDYPALTIVPVEGDFTRPTPLPAGMTEGARLGFFPGSTIGNFPPPEAEAFLRDARVMLGPGAQFLIGIDLIKDEATLVAAYDDAAGVTAAFNKNLLHRLRTELGVDIDPDLFDHRAVWNAAETRMEMHLVSRIAQEVVIADHHIRFAAGETIHTENSYKFDADSFGDLAATAGWRTVQTWLEAHPAFALVLLEN